MSIDPANIVVMKFGGTSVGSSERIGNVAKKVVARIKKEGKKVIVVVSAMSGETNRLIELGRKVAGDTFSDLDREYHQLVTAGEHASIALTASAIKREGCKSRSLLAHQIPIKTDYVLGQNLISDVDSTYLLKLLENDEVPVIAGFQGIDDENSYTTLGRGGSDTTAVAIAAALGPCRCEILTDIDGVYSALPSVCKKAKKLDNLSYEEMLELASSGAKVLQARSVALAHKFKVPLVVCSSFNQDSADNGTLIVEEYKGMEDAVVSGISCRTDEAKITIRNLPDEPGIAGKVLKVLGDSQVVVDMIVQSQGAKGKASISMTVPRGSAQVSFDSLSKLISEEVSDANIELDKDIAKLSIVGEGMRTHSGVAAKVFEVLGKENINVEMITTSEIKISIAMKEKYSELAVRALHEEFVENKNLSYN